ncbi:MAG TPA: multidrug effflux MFS transporter [Devosia sp.]|nr:multidrug effflux MFS transporter [Devosia sp.]
MPDQPSAPRVLSRVELIALIAGLMALNALAIDVMLPALPYIGGSLGVANANETEFIVSSYMVGFGAAQLAFGPISDRFGRRPPLFVGIALYVACALLAAFAPSFWALLILRFVQGLGAAATRVVAMAVIRDRYSGREMASVMSLAFMTFMAVPIIAPGIGQVILLVASWHYIFVFMTLLAGAMGLWAWFRLPETLHAEYRRELSLGVIVGGFRAVFSNRVAFFYGLCGMLFFSAMFGFLVCSQQIFVDLYGLGPYFPVAFASVAALMAVSNFVNSRIVKAFGQRRVSHLATLIYLAAGSAILVLALQGPVNFWVYYALLATLQFVFAWATSNMNSLSMEPLGNVAGTAAAVFGFMQTVGGAVIGTLIGQQFNGTLVPNAAAYVVMGTLVLVCVLIAEKGRLFGVGVEYQSAEATAVE